MSNEDTPLFDGGATAATGDTSGDDERPQVDPREVLLVGPDADHGPVVSVVLPTMNEEQGITQCLDWIENAILELGVRTEIIISDSSTDRTPEIARDRGAIVVEPDAGGYGNAYRYAFNQARGDYIVMGDADTTYDFSDIPRFIEHLVATDADVVLGSRLDGEIKPGAMPTLHQYVGNPLLTRFLNTFYDAGVSDAHSGFRVIRREALEAMVLESGGMEFASEMIIEADAKDLTIEELPIVYHEREGEETLESFRDGWRHVRFMLSNAPGYLFAGPAAAFAVTGVLLLVLSLIGGEYSNAFFGAHTAVLGSLFSILGFQVGTLALFSAVSTDTVRTQTDPVTTWIQDWVRIEHGVTAGLLLNVAGGTYLGYVGYLWIITRGAVTLDLVPEMIAFTAIVIGTQAVFSSFYFNMIADRRHC
jgi:glycosyltransferase involved in cell wall biosynthesis